MDGKSEETDDKTSNKTVSKSPELEDVFMKAIDVALSAKKTREMSEEAHSKARMIASLYERALAEAEDLTRVARTVASTANSVAQMAIRACQFHSIEQAFQENPHYNEKIKIEDFLSALDTGSSGSSRSQLHKSSIGENANWQFVRDAQNTKSKFSSTSLPRNSAFKPQRNNNSMTVQPPEKNMQCSISAEGNSLINNSKFIEKYPDSEKIGYLADAMQARIEQIPSIHEDVYYPLARTFDNTDGNSINWIEYKKAKQFMSRLKQAGIEDIGSNGSSINSMLSEKELHITNTTYSDVDQQETNNKVPQNTGIADSLHNTFAHHCNNNSGLCNQGSSNSFVHVDFPQGVRTHAANQGDLKKKSSHGGKGRVELAPLVNAAIPADNIIESKLQNKGYEAECDTTDDELEQYLPSSSSPRQIVKLKAMVNNPEDVKGHRLIPKAPNNPRLSPLLKKEEQDKVVAGDKSPRIHSPIFSHSPQHKFAYKHTTDDEESTTP